MSRIHLLLLAAAASFLGACTYYDAPPYEGARYQRHGTGYNTRYRYDAPWEVGYQEPYRRSPGYSTFGSYGGYRSGHGGYHNHGSSCGCDSCRSRYRSNKHDHHKSSSSSSRKSSSHKPSSSRSSSSSSSRKPSSSNNRSRSGGGGSGGGGQSKSERAKEWQKDKGGNPRAKRR